jgi:adenylosuccinate synthase
VKIFIAVGLSFGDEGKGTCTDALVRRNGADLVVRYNGGPQASHAVYDGDTVHRFSQFGSGTFVPGCRTLLGRHMLVNPITLNMEANDLTEKGVDKVSPRMFIDSRARLVLPYHRALNRLTERARGAAKHGSCGMGVGACVEDYMQHSADAVYAADLLKPDLLAEKLDACCRRLYPKAAELYAAVHGDVDAAKELSTFHFDIDRLSIIYGGIAAVYGRQILQDEQVADLMLKSSGIVFEGAQGVLLDENYGFHPHTTWSTTTTKNALLMLEEAEITERPVTVGITRSYMTRHGAGPFPTYSEKLTQLLSDVNNPENDWQGALKSGYLDLRLLSYALRVNGPVDYLAVTHFDRVTPTWAVAVDNYQLRYALRKKTRNLKEQVALTAALIAAEREESNQEVGLELIKRDHFLDYVEQALGTKIGIISSGPRHTDKRFLSYPIFTV